MVLPGQFLERPALIKVRTFLLEGLYQKGLSPEAAPALVAPAHSRIGGSMASPPVMELAYSLFRTGCPTLRFNFRGVGGSQGRASEDLKKGEEDFHAAAVHLLETTGQASLMAAGYSFGASVAFRCAASEPVHKLILLAPRLLDMDFFSPPRPHCPVLVIAGGNDPSCPGEKAKTLMEHLGNRGRLCIISEADHSFTKGLGEIGRLIVEFINIQDLR